MRNHRTTHTGPKEAFVSGMHRDEMRRDQRDRDTRNAAAPIEDTARAALVLDGTEAGAPMFAVALLAEDQSLSYNAMTAKLKGLMRVALYLSDAKVADLRAAQTPEAVEALAALVVDRYGVAFLETLTHQDPDDRDLFDKPGRMLAAIDAAHRWQWQRLLPGRNA